jgi:transcriptional regulator with XRE-family HTH domain
MAGGSSDTSPLDLGLGKPTDGSEHVGEVDVVWGEAPGFGPYLRKLRTDRGLSLRKVAKEIGISHAQLGRIETDGTARAPRLEFLETIARFYGRDTREVMHEAGIRYRVPESLQPDRTEREFRRLMTGPLRPRGVEASALAHYARLHKEQIIELALNLEGFVNSGKSVADLLGRQWDGDTSTRD